MCRVEPALTRVLDAGTVVGPYEVIARLGLGGMGQVFLAHDTRLQRKVALKYLTSQLSGDQTQTTVLREARAAARINHPNVAAVHDIFDDNGRTFIVMEYVDGESLAGRIARERLSFADVVSIARQLAAGLAAAHAEGIIHRDIKPSNVQLARGGTAKILDFGVAKATASILSTRTAGEDTGPAEPDAAGRGAGTPAYMSPEQKLGLRIDERSDIYSLGLVLLRWPRDAARWWETRWTLPSARRRWRRGPTRSMRASRPSSPRSSHVRSNRIRATDSTRRLKSSPRWPRST